ncbi:MAG: thiamine-phosphate kinase [Actinobacteria bacterium]|uniref:Unannotated protein n=1 Tax=freshwater metagenome TaxID=449393 RepID=A0A6J7ESE4_9ZZZZ|nr:thiamine-phosphate kinase [Actinomycetota bacterium]
MLEPKLLEALAQLLTPAGPGTIRSIGDDAAVSDSRGPTATSMDQTVEGIHADMSVFTHADFGWRAVATAASDMAAMGALPADVFVALALPDGTSQEDAESVVAGADAAATACGARIIGGDIVSSPTLSAAVTIVGVDPLQPGFVGRGGAKLGDLIGVTGALGGSAAGLIALRAGDSTSAVAQRHLRPTARIAEGRALAATGVTSMIDISDGIATDAGHIGAASGVCLEIRLQDLPVEDGVEAIALQSGVEPAVFAATGGEDFELLFTADPECRAAVELAVGAVGVSWIGEVTASEPGTNLTRAGLAGWQHGG